MLTMRYEQVLPHHEEVVAFTVNLKNGPSIEIGPASAIIRRMISTVFI